MANRSRPSQQKRHKERARQEKQKMKFERRQEAKFNRTNSGQRGPETSIPISPASSRDRNPHGKT